MQRRTVIATTAVALAGCAADSDPDSGDSSDGGDGEDADPEPEPSGLDPDAIEERFLERFNEMREDRALGSVYQDRFLSEMGEEHAANMAEHDYVGHVQPDTGMGIEDRYRDRGLLPQCEIDVPNSNRYYPGAENAAHTPTGRVEHPETGAVTHVNTDADVAAMLYDMWMASDGHREIMVLPTIEAIGLGVAVRADGEVFAALQFC